MCLSRLKNFFVSPAPVYSLEAIPDNPSQPASIFNRIGNLYTCAKKIMPSVPKNFLPIYASIFKTVATPATCIFYTAYVAGYFSGEEESELVGGLLALVVANVGSNALVQFLKVLAIFRKHSGPPIKRSKLKANGFLTCKDSSLTSSYYTIIFSSYSSNSFSGLTNLFGFVLFLKTIELFANDDPQRPALVAVNSIFGLLSMLACLLAYSAYTIEAVKNNAILVLNSIADDDWKFNRNHLKAFAICIFGAISHPCLLYDTIRASLRSIPFTHFSGSFISGVAAAQIPFIIITDLFSNFVAAYSYFKSRSEPTPEITGLLKALYVLLVGAIIIDSSMTGLSHFTAVAKKFSDPYGFLAIFLGTFSGVSAAFRNAVFGGYYGIEQAKAHDLPRYFPNRYRIIRDTSLIEAPHSEPEENKEKDLENNESKSIELVPYANNGHALFSHQFDTRPPVIIQSSVLDLEELPQSVL